MPHPTLSFVFLGLAILTTLLSIPLILRRIPMNHFYGVRFPEAYRSDESWFDLNEYGGRLLLGSSVFIYLVAFAGFVIPTDYVSRLVYSLAAPGVIIATLIFATIRICFYARFYARHKKG